MISFISGISCIRGTLLKEELCCKFMSKITLKITSDDLQNFKHL